MAKSLMAVRQKLVMFVDIVVNHLYLIFFEIDGSTSDIMVMLIS
jgi:hypothetical protein